VGDVGEDEFRAAFFEVVREVADPRQVSSATIAETTTFAELGIDSLSLVEGLALLDERVGGIADNLPAAFDSSIELVTVGDLYRSLSGAR
jgi:acyl carrier protein